VNTSSATLTLVMPVFNEEKTIEKSISEVLKHEFINQLVVVNDGSTDATSEILSKISDSRVKIVELSKNRGKGYALRTGFKNALGPYVGVQDADMEYDPADLAKLLAPLEKGLADAVFGSRFISSDAHRVLYFWHSVGNRFLTTLSNMFTNLNLTDMETCYKVLRKEILDNIELQENRFGFEPEITAKLAKSGARIYEVGISYNGRTYEDGKKIGWKDGFRAIYCIIKYAFRK
jgi:dolichol-phosphate mannosyltransferase